jgi:hypothetical protein
LFSFSHNRTSGIVCTRKDSMFERRIRLNFPGVIIVGVVDVGGGVAISLLLSLSLREEE